MVVTARTEELLKVVAFYFSDELQYLSDAPELEEQLHGNSVSLSLILQKKPPTNKQTNPEFSALLQSGFLVFSLFFLCDGKLFLDYKFGQAELKLASPFIQFVF